MKRRTIIAGTLMIGLVVMMLGVGSWAVFNDAETSPVTVGAGTIDLELNDTAVVQASIDAVKDLKPSEWHYLGPFWLHNAGSNPGVLDLHFQNVVDGPGVQTQPECLATWGWLQPDGLSCEQPDINYYVPVDDISNWIDVDYWIAGPYAALDMALVCPTPPSPYVLGKLGDIESTTFDLVGHLAGGQINHSEWYAICLSFHLEKDAGNEYQGDTSTFDILFTLHQVGQPADRETVRLENKDADYKVIGGDDTWGSVTYEVNADDDLEMQVRLNGLAPDTLHQLALNGPDGTGACEPVDDQLASGSEKAGNTGYDSGFWDGSGPNINQDLCQPGNNEGIYNFAYVTTDAQGSYDTGLTPIIVVNSGEADPANALKVGAANPALPVGIYSGVKFVVKEVTGPEPGTEWTPVMMEMQPLNFNLP